MTFSDILQRKPGKPYLQEGLFCDKETSKRIEEKVKMFLPTLKSF
jgi:hypothetical protein